MDHNGKAVRLLRAWQENYTRQTFISAALSCGCTALFALYHGYLGLRYWSLWHGSIGVFFLLLTAIRGSILVMEKRNSTKPEATRDRCRRWTFQISTALLLVLDLALAAPISMMALFAKPVYLGLNAAIAMAAYTTWKITMASVHLLRQRRRASGNILVSELRTVNFIDALVSILTLQNTLIMVQEAEHGTRHMLPLSAVSSAVIYTVIVSLTLRMLRNGMKQLKP